MRRQRKMAQRKEQNQTPEKELNEMAIANLLGPEFKMLVVRMLKKNHWVLQQHKKDPGRNEGYIT